MLIRIRLILSLAVACLVAAVPGIARAQALDATMMEAIREADMTLAVTGFRLSTANAALCDRLEPGHGMQFHTLAQYAVDNRGLVATHFAFAGTLAVEGIVPGSPAERADIRADDSVVSVGGVRPDDALSKTASIDTLAKFVAAVAALPPAQPIPVELRRGGKRLSVIVYPVPACRTRYELLIDGGLDARAYGDLVRITSGYYDRFGDELVAAAVAHELAHNILRHRERLDAMGADFGFASGFGRNVGLFRQTELQADILSVHLLARAGYPADLASRFWQHPVAKGMSGIFQSRSHPHWKDRLRVMQAEEAKIAAAGAVLPPAPFVAERDLPLTGEWKDLIPRD
ncbi:peptidase M48 family protein [Sphingomonas suaedae]|uniref:Peptidase M48 family protein n=1 Tax=Sphingomonas suaedae TaxID=2599297 RepID=A0A518RJ64_9SPHN|nr:M48 family metallopeptidase [Sphingomonas suaedae]QDX27483.1 peptidase M48 family protein [Sphingomonas suaedae]